MLVLSWLAEVLAAFFHVVTEFRCRIFNWTAWALQVLILGRHFQIIDRFRSNRFGNAASSTCYIGSVAVCRAAPHAIHPLVWTDTQLHLLAAWGGSGAPLICFIFWRFSYALLVVFVWKWISWCATELEDITYTELITDSENAGTDGRFNRNRSEQEKQTLIGAIPLCFAII